MFQDQFIRVGSINTRYWAAGDAGPPVLLLHGIGCSVLEWQHNMAALARHHRVFALDLLGFGLTDKPNAESYNLRRLAQFALDFLATVGVDQAHFAGNSLGGRLALECAMIAPQRVRSMVLVDPAGMDLRPTLLEFRLATLPVVGEWVTYPTAFGTRMLWRKAFARPDGFVTDEMVATKTALARATGAQAAFLKTLRGFLSFSGFRPTLVHALQAALPSMHMPVLVIWGRQDRFVPCTHAEVLQRGLPQVRVAIYDECGHAPMIECADRFNADVLAFWQAC